MSMPTFLAASTTTVPWGTVTVWLSIVNVTIFGIITSSRAGNSALQRIFLYSRQIIFTESVDTRYHRLGGKFTERAQAFVLHVACNGVQQVHIFFGGHAAFDARSEEHTSELQSPKD